MDQKEIKEFLKSFNDQKDRTMVMVDYGNVEKWKNSLNWKVDIKNLANLIKHLSYGKKFLRRFYYGSDYGPRESSGLLTQWSRSVLERAEMNRFEVITKIVKYIHSQNNKDGFEKKCDLDVEMTIDLIRERKNYDNIVLFSGDGDLVCAIEYLKEMYRKKCTVFAARGHIGREVIDALSDGTIDKVLYADDFEYRLKRIRFSKK